MLNSQNLSLQFFTTEKALEMDFDPEQIKQVMTNLISNAIKFTPSGGAIRVEVEKNSEGQLQVKVSDTGIGIAEKDLPFIFDRFYQVDGSTTRTAEGTGIGLAHANKLVKLMGGQITVDSQIDTGTTFCILLPIHHRAESSIDLGVNRMPPGLNQLANVESHSEDQSPASADLLHLLIISAS